MIGIYPEIYIESFRMLPTLHQINKEEPHSFGIMLAKKHSKRSKSV